MIRFGIVGSGYRAMFYVRVAKALPEIFDLCMVLCRSEEKAKEISKTYGVVTGTKEQELIGMKPDFIVSAVDKAGMHDNVIKWAGFGIPVLSETPVSLDKDKLRELWKMCDISGMLNDRQKLRIQVAEQYRMYPVYESIIKIIDSGIIGEPVSATISSMHDYHAVSMIRELLKTDMEDVGITGRSFMMPVTETKTRYETLRTGNVVEKEEKHLIMSYKNGKTAFYDFMSEQYRSPIRNKFLNVRGTRGEILGDTVYYLGSDNVERKDKISVIKDHKTDEVERIPFKGEIIYTPAFGICGLSEDETAVARVLYGMKKYVDTGEEFYPLKYALEDAYVAALMQEACDNPWTTVNSGDREWK